MASHQTPDFGYWLRGNRLGFSQAGNPVALFPLAAFFEDFDAFKAFEDIPLGAQSTCCPETTML
jgi:hypothetical protein